MACQYSKCCKESTGYAYHDLNKDTGNRTYCYSASSCTGTHTNFRYDVCLANSGACPYAKQANPHSANPCVFYQNSGCSGACAEIPELSAPGFFIFLGLVAIVVIIIKIFPIRKLTGRG